MLPISFSLVYGFINLTIALIVFLRSRKNPLSQVFLFCVANLVFMGLGGWLLNQSLHPLVRSVLENIAIFLYEMFPFFFLHFAVIFSKRYKLLESKNILIGTYAVGFASYACTMLGFIPKPISPTGEIASTAYVYYVTWMSVIFAIGTAMLYSMTDGFSERALKRNHLLTGLSLLLLALPSPFTESLYFVIFRDNILGYFVSSTFALLIAIYVVFRHKIIVNTPYDTLKTALGVMNDVLIKTDEHFRIQLVRGGKATPFGYTEDELLGHPLTEIIDEKDLVAAYAEYVFRGRMEETHFETDVIGKLGERVPMSFSFTPLFANEEIAGFVGIGRTSTERKLVEGSPYAIAIYDNDRIIFANTATALLLGATRAEQIIGKSLPDFIRPDDLAAVQKLFLQVMSGSREVAPLEARFKQISGKEVDVELTLSPFDYRESPAIQVIFRDITERKHFEREREQLVTELQEALGSIKTLRGLIPICASCKKIRDDSGYWNAVEGYIMQHTDAKFSHGICPDCMKRDFPNAYKKLQGE
jgi:PAS domain S-box-containing protein